MRKIQNSELARKSLSEFKSTKKRPFAIVLDNVRSLNNIGSVFRTADAFLCEQIFLCGITACPPHPEIHKTALGAEDSVAWNQVKEIKELISRLKKENYKIAVIEQAEGGIKLSEFKPEAGTKYAFVFGHEVHGVSQELMEQADLAIEIPQDGTKHSLNVAVCAGIIAWHFVLNSKT